MVNVSNSTGCDDLHIALLTDCVKHKKEKNIYTQFISSKCHVIYALYFIKITSHNRSTWRAVHSSTCDRKLTIISQLTFIDGSNFGHDVLFRPFT